MIEQLEELRLNALQELEDINNIKELESWRIHYLGKKSGLTQILRGLGSLALTSFTLLTRLHSN
jgi:phenylalanyl-tRNA synthetase alpha chain